MRWNALRVLFLVTILFATGNRLFAQIPTSINGALFNLPCNQVCTNLTFKIPHIKGPSDYVVTSLAYNPLPYTTAAPPMLVPCIDQDDKYFDVTNLPFTFCFYDSLVNKLVVSTNGSITFDITNALRAANYAINGGMILPFEGFGNQGAPGTCTVPTGTRLPKGGIFGVFCDIFPQTSDGLYKIESRVEGTAPYRKYVVSFSQVRMFNCSSLRLTSQIVLHESTGLIDIFIGNKPLCGLAIVGIQNFVPDQPGEKGLKAPGRGAEDGNWAASNEAWRFIPSGPGSRFVRSELLALDGTLLITADTATTTTGFLDLNFVNLCSPAGSTQYVVRTIFSSCSDPAAQLINLDTITINRTNSLNATNSTTNTACGPPTGTITVNISAGTGTPPYSYQLDGNAAVSAGNTYTFTGVAAGPHTVVVVDNSGGCTTTLNVTVGQNTVLGASPSAIPASCPGVNNGIITVNPTGGTGPYTFTLNPGAIVQTGASANFSGLAPGAYTVSVSDAGGCATALPVPVTVTAGAALTTTATASDVLCNGGSTGSITVNQPASGTPPFQYSLDGITWQNSNVFNGLPAGNYTVRFRENNGCQGQLTIDVKQPPVFGATNAVTAVRCNGESTGVITVTPVNGTGGNFQFSIDGGTNWQNNPVFNVPRGNYTVTIKDANGCIATTNAVVTEPAVLAGNTTITDASCNGGADGTISVTASGGNGGYQYALDNGAFQSSNVFNVTSGNYAVTIRDALGCTVTLPNRQVNLTNNLTYTVATVPVICEGSSTQLQINSNALQYAWSPATGLSNASISNPVANPATTTNYTVTLTLGACSTDVPVTVNVRPAPIPDAGPDGYICYGQDYQLQGSGGTRFSWTPSTYLNSDTLFNAVSTAAQTITYSLSVTDANGCPSLVKDQVTVDVTPPIKVYTFPADTIVYEGDQFPVLATSIATDYLWSPSTGLDNPAIPNPVVTAGVAGDVITYKVTASTFAGCKGDGFITIRVYKGPDIYMPTGFTPNGDGKNEIFRPVTVGIKQLNYFKIFNRWGQQIYSTKTIGAGWDGRVGGVPQASGVFVWMVEGVTEDDRIIRKRGTVTLIR